MEQLDVWEEENILDVMSNMMNNQRFADVKFLIGKDQKEFYANKIFLQNCSELWKTLFYEENWRQNVQRIKVVEIPSIEPEIFLQILGYVYLRRIILTKENSQKILVAAKELQIKGLVNLIKNKQIQLEKNENENEKEKDKNEIKKEIEMKKQN
ncbi:btb/poz domain-containing protein [Anaeramoeba flamelloides]|uniref:Btb/poz domain-containing protein n=1 Tax=Anaeramoeba flamelloides TaxID=1746091 RepID=A0ABQ8YY42_9EUKA|nr:btb/poz domain-containing protein [Anaeramoeba flamelloides]